MPFVPIRGLSSLGDIAVAAKKAREAIGKTPGVGLELPKASLDKLRWMAGAKEHRDFREVNERLLSEMGRAFTAALQLVMKGKADVTRPWLAAGEAYKARVQSRLAKSGDDVKMAALKPATIERKGSSQIGRDTGALYRDWKAAVVRLTR
jgi:hypothetical protein